MLKANSQLLKQINAHSPYMITSKTKLMIKIKIFKSEPVHVDYPIKPQLHHRNDMYSFLQDVAS